MTVRACPFYSHFHGEFLHFLPQSPAKGTLPRLSSNASLHCMRIELPPSIVREVILLLHNEPHILHCLKSFAQRLVLVTHSPVDDLFQDFASNALER